MQAQFIRDDALVRIEVDPGSEMITTTWKGYVPSPEYRTILLEVLDLVNSGGLRLWLSDSSCMGVILRSDEKWSIETFTPMLMQAGLRRVAVVRSMDFFSQTASERMVEATLGRVPYKVEFFNAMDKADQWLVAELQALA